VVSKGRSGSEKTSFYLGAGVPRRLACWSSRSLSCCSRSISTMRGTTRTRKVVPAIHAALPVLRRSFFATKAASPAASLPRTTMEEREILARTELELLGLSGSDTPPLLPWDAMEKGNEGIRVRKFVLTPYF